MRCPAARSRSGSRRPRRGSTRCRARSCAGSVIPACADSSTSTPPRTTRPGRARRVSAWPGPPGRVDRTAGERPMSEAIVPADAHGHADAHHELSFFRTYIFSTDHKMIAKQFLGMGLGMLLLGGLLALLVRWELAWPETAVPGMGWVPEPTMFDGVIPPETYNTF